LSLLTIAKTEVEKLISKANKGLHAGLDAPEVVINSFLVTTAGRAFGTYLVDFNESLFKKHPQNFINDVIPHEVAHIVTSKLYPGASPHGKEWKSVMLFFGVEPNRCHAMQVTKRRQRRWDHSCGCMVHKVATVTHNRIQKGVQYRCNKCKNVIEKIT